MTDLMPDQRPDCRCDWRADSLPRSRPGLQPTRFMLGLVELVAEAGAHRSARSHEHGQAFLFDWYGLTRSVQLYPLSDVVAPIVKVSGSTVDPRHLRDVDDVLVAQPVDVAGTRLRIGPGLWLLVNRGSEQTD